MSRKIHYKQSLGFSLLEMAVVLTILGFVVGALLLPLQAQREVLFQAQTLDTLEAAKTALLGYAQRNGRLPCPATATSNIDPGSLGVEQPAGGTGATDATCDVRVGFLPAATLGIQPTDSSGFALDGWNNRIRYAVTQVITNTANPTTAADFTTSNKMANVGMTNLAPDLRVCASASVITSTTCSALAPLETNYLINNAIAVIYSTGATGSQAVGGIDENANLNDADANGEIDDGVFVSHEISASNSPNGEFDHLLVWISPYTLYNAMIEAGQLH